MNLLEHINPAHIRQRNIEHHHIAFDFSYLAQCFNTAASLSHHAHFTAFLNDLFQPVTNDGMVICNQNTNHAVASLLAARGNITVTRRPPPGDLSNLICPSSCATRSRMPRIP